MGHRQHRLLACGLGLLLTACGGGGGNEPETPAAAVARIEIAASGMLLTSGGETRQLAVRAFDAAGNELPPPDNVTWSSSRAGSISVDNRGVARAEAAHGSAQLVATAGGVTSPPLLAVAAQPAGGVMLLSDAQIAGDPTDSDPTAAPGFDNTYRVTLAGGPVPAAGALVLGTGSKPVAGRVVAVDTNGPQPVLVMQLVPLRELLPQLTINEVIDLRNAVATINPDIAATYDMTRSGDTYTFTPKPAASRLERPHARPGERRLAAVGTRALTPFNECKPSFSLSDDAPLPISLSAPPTFSITLAPTLDYELSFGDLERFVVKAEPVFKIEGGVTITSSFEGKIECTAQFGDLRIPVGGFLSFIAAGIVEFGVSMEAGGKFTLVSMGVTSKVESTTTATVGVTCVAPAGCGFTSSLGSFTTKFEPKVDLPAVADLCVEPSLGLGGTLKLKFGSPFLRSLRVEFAKAKAGAKLAGKFGPLGGECNGQYALSLDGSAGVGAEFDGWLKFFGISEVTLLEATVTDRIGGSPTATEVLADRGNFAFGETARMSVKLDPSLVDFIPGVGPYNVDRVLLLRRGEEGDDGTDGPAVVVAAQTAAPGQTAFLFDVVGANALNRTGDYYAAIVTKLLPLELLAVQLGPFSANASTWGGTITSSGNGGPSGALLATLSFFSDGTFSGVAAGFPVSGRIEGTSISFGIASGSVRVGEFSGTTDTARTRMSGSWSGLNLQTGGTDSGTWELQLCTGNDLPVPVCPPN
jgi:hypothetical protein